MSRTEGGARRYRKKLIEVDLPLAAINKASVHEKSIRHGHPSTLHLWWARRPLAACRSVIFASMVDDPGEWPDEFETPEEQRTERKRLHGLIEQLVVWKDSNDENLLAAARWEIAHSLARSENRPPAPPPDDREAVLRYLAEHTLPVYDLFAGGGSIPLEAQRLGLKAIGTDLNPIAVLINKALIELPPRFRDRPPTNPAADPFGMKAGKGRDAPQVAWRGATGLANDIRWYGRWLRGRAWERLGQFYPKATLPDGSKTTVIAWLWARTIPCPNPACGVAMPLMRTFQLSKKTDNERWANPVVERGANTISFEVQDHLGEVPDGGTVSGAGATCVACRSSTSIATVRVLASAGKMGEQMIGIVGEGDHGRRFLSPTSEHERAAIDAVPKWRPAGSLPEQALGFRVQRYGVTEWYQLFTERQLTALTTFSALLAETHALLAEHGATEDYANAVITYLAMALGRSADAWSSFATWDLSRSNIRGVFGMQTLPMRWDYAEANPFSSSTQNWTAQVEWIARAVERLPAANAGEAHQANAATTIHAEGGPVIVTDPPYYDNIGYADLSDFFYVWLRPALREIYPDLFAGLATPKSEEMTASPRFENPREHFETSMHQTLNLIRERCTPEFPSSIFYAYKQQEEEQGGRASTGWDTMLTAVVGAGFRIVGTWPMRTELANRQRGQDSNALASSVVLVCRPRDPDAPTATRREFLDALDSELPATLDQLTREGHIAPVDLAQAAIGPGMEVYSRYSRVETIAGELVTVREALGAINRAIAAYHRQEQGALDAPSRFCMEWLRQYDYADGLYGDAETLARAVDVEVAALAPRLLTAGEGKVRLRPTDGFSPDPQLSLDGITAWEGCFRMAFHLDTATREDAEGEPGAARVALAMGDAESAERLARILYEHYDRSDDSRGAARFNRLVMSWQQIRGEMLKQQGAVQGTLPALPP